MYELHWTEALFLDNFSLSSDFVLVQSFVLIQSFPLIQEFPFYAIKRD